MTKDELKKKAEMMIRTAVGRDEIDDFVQDVIEYLESQPQIVRCKDCIHYGKPEYGYTKGDCRFHTAWYPVDENDYCSKAQRRTDTN